jgi:hypothetical protein
LAVARVADLLNWTGRPDQHATYDAGIWKQRTGRRNVSRHGDAASAQRRSYGDDRDV